MARASTIAAALLTMLAGVPSFAGDLHDACKPGARCAGNPLLAGACFTLHGEMHPYNGNPTFRIHRTGTKRILGVLCDEDPILAGNVKSWLNDPKVQRWDLGFSADFKVCPFTVERRGRMQMVCVEQADNLVVTDREKKLVLKDERAAAVPSAPASH